MLRFIQRFFYRTHTKKIKEKYRFVFGLYIYVSVYMQQYSFLEQTTQENTGFHRSTVLHTTQTTTAAVQVHRTRTTLLECDIVVHSDTHYKGMQM